MHTWEIHIEGVVQGVGFRPFVYQLAKADGWKGQVSNGPQGVKIRVNGEEDAVRELLINILRNKPSISHVTHSKIQKLSFQPFETFEIVESQHEGVRNLALTPDYGLCEDCRREMLDPTNRRFCYPFITCTKCGPRFSLMTGLPYDRPQTHMDSFLMCESCLEEYHDPHNRRHHSQTNSCPDCGVKLLVWNAKGEAIAFEHNAELQAYVIKQWEAGKIVALKGLGGFLLTCDATNAIAIRTLRERKNRPSKPLAVMYPSLDILSQQFELSDLARKELMGPASPIVLVPKTPKTRLAPGIAPGLGEIGVMLPYAPLFEWLLSDFGKPIVATSANISKAPIIFQNEEAVAGLSTIADLIVGHDRQIAFPVDDSVVRISPNTQKRIVIRRSRGLAPVFFLPQGDMPKGPNLLAMGGDLKSTFALRHEKHLYLGPYLGDLSHYDTQLRFQTVCSDLQSLLQAKPTVVLCDSHPNYESHRLGGQYARELGIPLKTYQHHKAHFAAVLGESNLVFGDKKILGVIWDGTGYGEDGNIWGGEFFTYEKGRFDRISHTDYFPVLAGDRMSKEPRLSALSLAPDLSAVKQKFSAQEWTLLTRRIAQSQLQTSSMGRLFDAVSSVLGLVDIQQYEGHAAMLLEQKARAYLRQGGTPDWEVIPAFEGNPTQLIQELASLQEAGLSAGNLALMFHAMLVKWVEVQAHAAKVKDIAFSGGVFQNTLLVDLLQEKLSDSFALHFHSQLSPNDECLAYGQIMLHQIETAEISEINPPFHYSSQKS